MSDIVLSVDQTIAEIPVVENGEPLVDLDTVDALRVERRPDSAAPGVSLRLGLVDRLIAAQTLLPAGLLLLVVDGHRPLTDQRRRLATALDELRRARPDWSEEKVRATVRQRVQPGEFGSHLTGGAVDLTLCHRSGEPLWLGSALHTGPEASSGACYAASPVVSPDARARRLIIRQALAAVDLVNRPTAWWHWSYGDRYWAYVCGAESARYGPV
ncbi:M15 family metallopeptidase [Micromonospora sp. NPDC050397]|uniref:M15 family metallopeptidase n=1 Tax=Micromonospora sp. NPDC050397 TaxID=3364279 RepID=UPI00384C0408